jgi:Mg-chelatase subunit ChlD
MHGQGDGGHHGATGSNGGPARFFQMPVSSRRIVFVIDRSLSMGSDGALALARRELIACLRSLSPDSVFQVVLYNLSAEPLPGGMLAATDGSLSCVEQVLARTHPSGGTDHVRALRCAFELRPEVIFLVTDADDLTTEQVRLIAAINRDHVVIHTINVGQGESAGGMLEQLARQSGGQYVRLTAPR